MLAQEQLHRLNARVLQKLAGHKVSVGDILADLEVMNTIIAAADGKTRAFTKRNFLTDQLSLLFLLCLESGDLNDGTLRDWVDKESAVSIAFNRVRMQIVRSKQVESTYSDVPVNRLNALLEDLAKTQLIKGHFPEPQLRALYECRLELARALFNGSLTELDPKAPLENRQAFELYLQENGYNCLRMLSRYVSKHGRTTEGEAELPTTATQIARLFAIEPELSGQVLLRLGLFGILVLLILAAGLLVVARNWRRRWRPPRSP